MVEGGSTGRLPAGTLPAHPVPWGAPTGVPTPFGPARPPGPAVSTDVCHDVAELDEVFGTRSQAAHCWCQFDRLPLGQLEVLGDDRLREMLDVELHRTPAPGVVARLGAEPVGWCSVAPRQQFERLRTCASTSSPATAADDPAVWSVTCFVVRPGVAWRGVASALLAGAVEHARSGGAGWVEGYPVDQAGRRATPGELYRGTLALFRSAGFEVVARPRSGRAIVRLEL